jgi:hypothetical protein
LVTGLVLSNNNLHGTIPAEIGLLSSSLSTWIILGSFLCVQPYLNLSFSYFKL